jgi:hypothetical protein
VPNVEKSDEVLDRKALVNDDKITVKKVVALLADLNVNSADGKDEEHAEHGEDEEDDEEDDEDSIFSINI